MKHAPALLVVSLALLLFAAEDALAHGGGSFRGPGTAVPPGIRGTTDPLPPPPPPPAAPTLACDCCLPTCMHCADPMLTSGDGLRPTRMRRRVIGRWGDLARVRVELWFEGTTFGRPVEAYARVGAGSLLAVTKATLMGREGPLEARLTRSTRARRDYLWERFPPPRRRARDPLLVLPALGGGVHVRAFPVVRGAPTYVALEGYTLAEPVRKPGVRLYVTRMDGEPDRYVAVLPEALLPAGLDPDHVDAATGRALCFLEASRAHGLFGVAADLAQFVPGIPELATAALGEGERAVNIQTALIAIPAGRGAPRGLRVLGPPQP